MDHQEAFQTLVAGNQRFALGSSVHPHQTVDRRMAVENSQNPFAVVLGCADSRVPPEIIFDQGIGDLFVVRIAGNIASDAVLGSVQFAIEKLGVALVVVLGHEGCGAVAAAVEHATSQAATRPSAVWTWQSGYLQPQGRSAPGSLGKIVQAISPAVEVALRQPGDLRENAARANIVNSINRLKAFGPLAQFAWARQVELVGAYYHLGSGIVSWLPV